MKLQSYPCDQGLFTCYPAIVNAPGGGGGVHLPFGLENRWSNLDTKAGDHDIPNNNSRIDFTTPCPFLSL